MNRVNIKQLFKNVSANLLQEFHNTEKTLEFAPDRGGQREEAIREFLREKLPRRYGVSKGFVVSHKGIQSNQCDVIIYDADSSPVFYKDINQEVFPSETTYGIIEVKSKLTSIELKKAIENIKAFKQVPRDEVKSVQSGGLTTMYSKSLNPKMGAVICYTLGDEYTNKSDEEISNKIILEIKKEKLEERIDFLCIIDKGIILPVKQVGGSTTIMLFDESVEIKKFGDKENSIGLFFITLLSNLNSIRLSQPDLFSYFNQS